MKRLLFSTRALWHAWRHRTLLDRAYRVLDAAEAHGLLADGYLLSARYLARAPLPSEDSGAGKPRGSEPSPAGGCSFAAQVLLGSIVGLAICALWIWISARAGR